MPHMPGVESQGLPSSPIRLGERQDGAGSAAACPPAAGGGAQAHSHLEAAPRPGLYKRFKQAAKKLKREVLALYYAMQDPRTGYLPRLLGVLVLAYALSPFDLIPDFIPILGLVDDLLLLPGMIWLSIKLIPAKVMEESRARAETEFLRLRKNWVAAVVILALWDALLLWLVYVACMHLGMPKLQQTRWWVVGGAGGGLMVVEAAWCVWQARKEALREAPRSTPASSARPSGAADEDGTLEEGLLSKGDREEE